ncbi:Structural maintenance of chromosomes protein 4 [Datura stramonium]|uniref:Structural maintenance of chromosomes protein 4 n=1 Tax=Datura stramonium TaxID=4076 RepID=A0ABS8VC46_DATST|nr:Structural maintenance of chromosomes protein 4 [Datura stramonium]
MKKVYKDLEIPKGKGYKKKLDDLQIALSKHIEQIQKDLVEPEKLQATLSDGTLGQTCDLKTAQETVSSRTAEKR